MVLAFDKSIEILFAKMANFGQLHWTTRPSDS
jgi:hypothetical protein